MTLIQDPPTRTGPPAPGTGPAAPPDAATGAASSSSEAHATSSPADAHATASGADAASPGAPGAGSRPPVLKFADSMGRALDHLVEAPTWAMSDDELGEALVALTREQVRLGELRMRVLLEADARQVGHDVGATSTAAWLALKTKLTRASIFADLHLARALDQDFTLTRAAMTGQLPAGTEGAADDVTGADADVAGAGAEATAEPTAGVVDAEKARIIIRAVEGITQDHGDLVTPEVRNRAEAHLVDLAGRFDAPTLKQLAKRLVEVVCPEAADAAEGKKLDAEEQAARRKAYVQIRHNGDGTSSGSFKLPTLHAELWAKALDELTSPRKLGDARLDPDTGRPYSVSTLRGHGFMALLEQHLNLDTLPGSAGSPFTLVVHVNLDVLQTGLGVAAVETGHRISAAEARRLSCNAAIIPMVLGGDSMPLDLGRERRFFTKHQRIGLDHLYRGCATDGCHMPPSRVEYHHLHAWHQGGRTDLKDGLPLCPPHHHMADHPDQWDMQHLPNGAVRFTRRQ